MPFLIGPMEKKLRSEKHLTVDKPILHFEPEIVSLPITCGKHTGIAKVKVGDYVKQGQMVALRNDDFYVPFFAPVSGEVIEIAKKMSAKATPCQHVVIKNDFKHEKEELAKVVNLNSSKEEIIDFMKEIGLLGMGGAGFPAYIKFSEKQCDTLIINGVECEPYLTADYFYMLNNQKLFKDGVKLMIKALDAKECYIALKNTNTKLIPALEKLFADEKNIKIIPVRNVYPMGWERKLIKTILHKTYKELPNEVNVVVENSTTAITLAKTIQDKVPLYERMVTLSGENLEDPHNVICTLGTCIKDLIELCGGAIESPANILMGGPMMGACVTKDEVCINRIVSGITIYKHEESDPMPCLHCGRCAEYCPSGLQPCNIAEALKIQDINRLGSLKVLDCVECGMCTYVCPSRIEVTEAIRRAKRMYKLRRK